MGRASLLAFLALAGCPGGADSDPLVGGDDCTALADGRWIFTGPAWGMGDAPMEADLAMDEDACAFSFSNFDMAMDDLPTGGVLDGAAVFLDGLTSYWRTCTGTATDERHAAGICEESGQEWAIDAEEGDTDTDTDADTDSDADSDADSDTDTDPTDCATINPGDDWAWTGECPGMRTPCALAVDDCDLTLTYFGMTMGMPYSGSVDGTAVTFADDDTVHGCVGVVESPDRITGTCEGPCTYVLSR